MQELARQLADESQQISLRYRPWILFTGANSHTPLTLVMSGTIQTGYFVYQDLLSDYVTSIHPYARPCVCVLDLPTHASTKWRH